MFRTAGPGQSALRFSAALAMSDRCHNRAHPVRCFELTTSASVAAPPPAHVVLLSHVTKPGARIALATHPSAHTRSASPLGVELRGMWRRAKHLKV